MMASLRVLTLAFVIVGSSRILVNARAQLPVSERSSSDDDSVSSSFEECLKRDSIKCIQHKVQKIAEDGLEQLAESAARTFPGEIQMLARSMNGGNVPEDLQQNLADAGEGRGRGKKILRALLPILLGMKVKFATVLGLTYLGIILMAKKALAISLISVAISAFLLLRKMFFGHGEHGNVIGWSGPPARGDAIASSLAYSAYNPLAAGSSSSSIIGSSR